MKDVKMLILVIIRTLTNGKYNTTFSASSTSFSSSSCHHPL
jgi:hypothetical protein